MILNEAEVTERMNSPMNLLNRLRVATKPNRDSNIIPSLPPSADEVIKDLEDKLAFGSIKSKAANIMIAAMDELNKRLPDVTKPEALARITESMSKVVNAEVKDNRGDDLNRPQIIMYAPAFHNENHYETIHARE